MRVLKVPLHMPEEEKMRMKGKKPRSHGRTAAPQMAYDVVATTTTPSSEAFEEAATVMPSNIDTITASSRVTWEYYLA